MVLTFLPTITTTYIFTYLFVLKLFLVSLTTSVVRIGPDRTVGPVQPSTTSHFGSRVSGPTVGFEQFDWVEP